MSKRKQHHPDVQGQGCIGGAEGRRAGQIVLCRLCHIIPSIGHAPPERIERAPLPFSVRSTAHHAVGTYYDPSTDAACRHHPILSLHRRTHERCVSVLSLHRVP